MYICFIYLFLEIIDALIRTPHQLVALMHRVSNRQNNLREEEEAEVLSITDLKPGAA